MVVININSQGRTVATAQEKRPNAFHGSVTTSLLGGKGNPGFISRGLLQGGPLVYISSPPSGTVNIYSASGDRQKPIGEISGLDGPTGLAVDRSGNLWVHQNSRITGFHRGSLTPFASLKASPGFGLAINAAGTIYAATSANVIEIYARGSTKPTTRLTDSQMFQIWNVAVDRHGNIFCNGVQYVDSSQEVFPVDEFRANSGLATRIMYLGYRGGLSVGLQGSLVVQDVGRQTISTYQKPYSGDPSSAFHYRGYPSSSSDLALTAAGDEVWIMNGDLQRQAWGEKLSLATGSKLDVTSAERISPGPDGIAVDPSPRF